MQVRQTQDLGRSCPVSLDGVMEIKALIAYFNCTMAKPIKWTYTGLSS